MNGRYTRDMLVSGEQIGLGGADTVRGFEEPRGINGAAGTFQARGDCRGHVSFSDVFKRQGRAQRQSASARGLLP